MKSEDIMPSDRSQMHRQTSSSSESHRSCQRLCRAARGMGRGCREVKVTATKPGQNLISVAQCSDLG